MNILMLTLMYPHDQMAEVTQKAKDKLQNQINNYQHAFVEGIRQNFNANEKLDVLNCLPVGIYPLQYRQLFLKSGWHDNGTIKQLGCINFPWFKQKCRYRAAKAAIRNWLEQDKANRTVLVYTQYLPYMRALAKLKKQYSDLKVTVIVTDLPNEMGLASGRKGLLKKLEYKMGSQSLALLRQMDGYVLLTESMAEALQLKDKPYTVIEGLILSNVQMPSSTEEAAPVFLYTGTLEPGLGIAEMLKAFQQMPEYELRICGQGTMKSEIEAYAAKCSNIHYLGFVSQQEALALQASATALLNPRQPDKLFTRYSFPSKTLEYMRSGKPVLCCKLEGIPDDYDPYLTYMEAGETGIMAAVQKLMTLTPDQRMQQGQIARSYVLEQKNPSRQCHKLLAFLRRL